MSEGSILFIDAYDSFSNNIIALLKAELSVSVETIKIDDLRFVLNDDAFYEFLNGFDAVVAGPGPGHPASSADVGLIGKLWTPPDDRLIPVLGICLAFQSMALAFGGEVERLREPRHGMVTPVLHCGRDVFENAGEVEATQYHSLHVTLGPDLERLAVKDLWGPSNSSKKLIPLAWDLSDEKNGPVLMGARHCHKPFWGVQYHPESICTNKTGQRLVKSWWKHACAWNSIHRCSRIGRKLYLNAEHPKLLDRSATFPDPKNTVQWTSFQMPGDVEVVGIANLFRAEGGMFQSIILESGLSNGKPVNAETGRTSIVGLPHGDSIHIRYSVKNRTLTVSTATSVIASWSGTMKDAFAFLESFVEQHKATGGFAGVPFWGGLVGFVSYEAGLESIDVEPAPDRGHSAIWLVFVERSIVIDHVAGLVYVQSIRGDDNDWLASTEERIRQLEGAETCRSTTSKQSNSNVEVVYRPEEEGYCGKVGTCQDHLRAGSSYELCLTDTTLVGNDADPWQLYLRLRQFNPAPFGAYFSTSASCSDSNESSETLHFLSSSPERFFSWSRGGKCQFRPIKGTVKKGPGMNREKAERILNSPKEQAENLMIVDLIRHDLNGVAGARNVEVPKLMSVEEYETVYQLVSVIEGDLYASGIPVLAASLPPGSMTGAPKKRSCELLHEIEGAKPRGLYSGVFGYLDVGGGGDFSVVIRSAFKWNEEEWRIGAGGAVTALSDAEAEWEEMLAKRENVLRAFS